jgi:CRP/FNR family transcriptional regulator, cyclic AMP receptor protein
MKTIDMVESLAALPFFSGMPERHLAFVSGCAAHLRCQPGEFLLLEGQPADSFFVVRSGRVAVEISAGSRGAIIIETLHEGDVLGWSWLIPPYRWTFDARSLDSVSSIRFDARCVREKCGTDPGFGYEMLRRFSEIMAKRLTATRLQLMDVYR